MLKSNELLLNQNAHCSYMHQHILLTRLSGLDLSVKTGEKIEENNFKLPTEIAQQQQNVTTNSFKRNGLPLSDSILFNSNNAQTLRQKKIPTKSMQGALKVLNDSLTKPPNLFPSQTALKIIQIEWFKISSLVTANPLDVEDYLDTFEDISSLLLEFIVNIADKNGNTAMHYAISHGNFDVVSILLDSKVCDINKTNKAGYNSVMLLVSLKEIQTQTQANVVRKLLELADVNLRATKQHGQTALMLAVSHGHFNLMKMLLEVGADVNIQDDDGSTALLCATEHGHLEIVKYLLNQPDCDSTISDNDGKTALNVALESGNRQIAAFIYNHQSNTKSNNKTVQMFDG